MLEPFSGGWRTHGYVGAQGGSVCGLANSLALVHQFENISQFGGRRKLKLVQFGTVFGRLENARQRRSAGRLNVWPGQ